jgi:O-antigen ligase
MSHSAETLKAQDTGPALPVLFFFAPLATMVAPRLTWLPLLLLAAAAVFLYRREGEDWRALLQPSAVLIAVLLPAVYALLSVSWAPEPGEAAEKAALLLVVAGLTFAAGTALCRLDPFPLHQASLAMVSGAILGALFILIELLTAGALTRSASVPLAWLGSERHAAFLQLEKGIRIQEFRQNAALIVLFLWPALLFTKSAATPRRFVLAAVLVFPAILAVGFSGRLSAQAALLASILVFALALAWPRGVIRTLAALWVLGFVLVLPAAFAAYNANLHVGPSLPMSAKARVIIWEYTAERVLDRPVLGVGAASTPVLHARHGDREWPEGYVHPRATGSHAHNIFLQTWYELGFLGVILMAIAGAVVALRISALSAAAQPFGAATFAAFGGMAAFAWSMWQTWFMCGMALAVLLQLAAARALRASERA